MAVLTEETHSFEGLMAELPGGMSRKKVTAQADATHTVLQAGTVMGKITAGNWAIHDNAAVDGTENLTAGECGILLTRVTSLTGEDAIVVFNNATYRVNDLHFATGMDASEQAAALATLRDTADIRIDARA